MSTSCGVDHCPYPRGRRAPRSARAAAARGCNLARLFAAEVQIRESRADQSRGESRCSRPATARRAHAPPSIGRRIAARWHEYTSSTSVRAVRGSAMRSKILSMPAARFSLPRHPEDHERQEHASPVPWTARRTAPGHSGWAAPRRNRGIARPAARPSRSRRRPSRGTRASRSFTTAARTRPQRRVCCATASTLAEPRAPVRDSLRYDANASRPPPPRDRAQGSDRPVEAVRDFLRAGRVRGLLEQGRLLQEVAEPVRERLRDYPHSAPPAPSAAPS